MKKTSPNKKATQGDLEDSQQDKKQLRPDESTMDLPDVRDIPGQEHIHPPKMKSFVDTTISSDDEEGKGIDGLYDEEEMDSSTNVSTEEKELLEESVNSMSTPDDLDQRRAMIDNRDEDGELLNESGGASGRDLDVPGSEGDDETEDLGEEDEENNSYSLGADKD